MKKTIAFLTLLIAYNSLYAQINITAAFDYPKAVTDSVMRSASGISGAGKPVSGHFFGGHVGMWQDDITVTEENKKNMPMVLLLQKDIFQILNLFGMCI